MARSLARAGSPSCQGAGGSVKVMAVHWDAEAHPMGSRITAELHGAERLGDRDGNGSEAEG